MYQRLILALIILAVVAWGANQASQPSAPFKPGKLPPEETAKLKPGLTLRFFKDMDSLAKPPLDSRRARLAALHVPAGSPPSPWLAPGAFAASFTGFLKVPEKGDYTFRAVVSGSVKLHINGKETLTAADAPKEAEASLARGYNRLDITYSSPPQGNASLRIYWAGEGFASEPLPPDMLFSSGDDEALTRGLEMREGRVLYATLGCVRCHALPGNLKRNECVLPELEQRAPSLAGAGDRLEEGWMRKWILDPRALRPEATMPQVLRGDEAKKQASDLAAYLATLRAGRAGGVSPPKNPQTTDRVNVHQGADAPRSPEFSKIGCAACHYLEDPAKDDPFHRLSLFYVPAKFKPGALAKFLQKPHEHYPWTRMPDFKLTEKEAASLAKFLTDHEPRPKLEESLRGDPERGAKLFREVGCASCHSLTPDEARPIGTLKTPASTDALACATRNPKAPAFRLSEQQVKSLRTFFASDGRSLTRETPAEFSLRQFQTLQCASCHRRDGAESRWQTILDDEGVPPQHYLPSLTWAGQKLKPEWTVKLLEGKIDHRARPWLQARMPAFPARAKLLAVGLSHEHGYAVDEDARPAKNAELAAVGAKLLPAQGGFNCINCHAVGKQPAVAPFEAPGINLTDAALRLRYEYYPRWMFNPPRVDNRTRMLKFVEEDGQTTKIREVFDGNARKQFDAIWQYLQTLPEHK